MPVLWSLCKLDFHVRPTVRSAFALSDIVGHYDSGFTVRGYTLTLYDPRKKAVQALSGYLAGTASSE